jgi:addiction module HigA family antidote
MTLRSRTTTKAIPRRRERRMPPIHPGEMLREEFMQPLGLSANALALALQVPATRISEIVNERRGISGDTAMRLGRYFRMTPQFWMSLQSHYELEVARDEFDADYKAIRPAPVDKLTGELTQRWTA